MKKTPLALAALMFASGFAAAADLPMFRYSADDLTTIDGIIATHERIEAAAQSFCREKLRGTRTVSRSVKCTGAVVDEIVSAIDDARLTAYATTGTVAEDLLATG